MAVNSGLCVGKSALVIESKAPDLDRFPFDLDRSPFDGSSTEVDPLVRAKAKAPPKRKTTNRSISFMIVLKLWLSQFDSQDDQEEIVER